MQGTDMEGVDNVGLGDKNVDVSTFDRYRGRKGVQDRVAVVSKSLLRTRVHYIPDKKKTIKCNSTPTVKAACCTLLGEPDQRFGLLLFKYLTDESGELLAPDKLSGKMCLWIFSESRYAELSALHKEHPLLDAGMAKPQVDMLIRCTEETYQRMSYTPCRACHYKTKETWYTSVLTKAQKAQQKLVRAMGQSMSDDEIRELLGVFKSAPPSVSDSEFSIDEVMD